MESPLWSDKHAPTIEEIPQPSVREFFARTSDEPLNILIYGPKGVGKTAAVKALVQEIHDDPVNDFVELNVADFFNRTKREIRDDERFQSFLRGRSDLPKRDMINHILKEQASYPPVGGSYRTVLLDNSEGIREDYQQALRRVMEQYYQSTQFIIATRQPSKLIAPIQSRCFPVPMRAPTHTEIVQVLERIANREGVPYDQEGLEYIAGYSNGDLRRAILAIQTTFEIEGEITMGSAYESLGSIGVTDAVEEIFDAIDDGEFTDARSGIDTLLYDRGFDGTEVLEELLTVARSRYDGRQLATLYSLAGEIDLHLAEGTTDRVHLGKLLAEVGQ